MRAHSLTAINGICRKVAVPPLPPTPPLPPPLPAKPTTPATPADHALFLCY